MLLDNFNEIVNLDHVVKYRYVDDAYNLYCNNGDVVHVRTPDRIEVLRVYLSRNVGDLIYEPESSHTDRSLLSKSGHTDRSLLSKRSSIVY